MRVSIIVLIIVVVLSVIETFSGFLFARVFEVPLIGPLLLASTLELFLLMLCVFVMLSAVATMAGIQGDRATREFRYVIPYSSAARFWVPALETMFLASWMALLFSVPVLIAYARRFPETPTDFLVWVPVGLIALIVISSLFGVLLTLLARWVLALRPFTTLTGGFLVLGSMVYLFLRALPEQLILTPAEAPMELLETLSGVTNFSLPGFPSHELTIIFSQTIRPEVSLTGVALLRLGGVLLGMILLAALIGPGLETHLQRSVITQRKVRRPLSNRFRRLLSAAPPMIRSLFTIDLLRFVRDRAQWFQAFLLVILFGVYLSYIGQAPGVTFYERVFYQSLNLLIISFFIIAVTTRFLLPLQGLDGKARWILDTSPNSKRSIFWIRELLVAVPIGVLATGLALLTGWVQNMTVLENLFAGGLLLGLTFVLVSFAILLGALFPQEEAEHVGLMVTSPVGLLYIGAGLAWMIMNTSTLAMTVGPNLGMIVTEATMPGSFYWAAGILSAINLLVSAACVLFTNRSLRSSPP